MSINNEENHQERSHVLDPSSAATLRREVKAAKQEATKAGLRLAQLLFDVHYGSTKSGTSLVVAWGFESFEEYAEREVEMHGSTALGYVSVYDELCIRRGLALGRLPSSITKLRLLARLSRKLKTNEKEMLKWVDRSRDLGCCELEHEAEEAHGIGSTRHKTVGFYMKWSHVEPLMRALRAAKTAYGLGTNGEALTTIVNEWTKELKPRAVAAAG